MKIRAARPAPTIAAGLTLALAVGAALTAAAPAVPAAAAAAEATRRPPAASPAPAPAPGGIAGWRLITSYPENSLDADQGVATVFPRHSRPYQLYRGNGSIPASVAAQGWTHVGDPDSARGFIFDVYQWGGATPAVSKMFMVTTPSGAQYEYVHTLVSGEEYNNSFAAISPGARWMVAGEWDTMTHLQVYPTPLLNRATARTGGTLDLAGYIELDHPVSDIQGCDFVTPRRLICESDDDTETLFPDPKPLLEVILATRLHGHDVAGHVIDLGPIPQVSTCSGEFEAEGDDYDAATGVLRLTIVPPGACASDTTVYAYRRASGRAPRA